MFGERIAALAAASGEGVHLQEVTVGLGYTLACLDNGASGVAYTLREELKSGCDAFAGAGKLEGKDVDEVLAWIGRGPVIASAVGLAAANALLPPSDDVYNASLFEVLRLQAGERLVTVGRFRPMEAALEKEGVRLEVVERGDPTAPLRDCDVALITATSIINGTLEGIIAAVGAAREVVILGPSTPCAPSVFAGTPVTLLAGSAVADLGRVRKIVREGGGTQILGKSMRRWAARVGK